MRSEGFHYRSFFLGGFHLHICCWCLVYRSGCVGDTDKLLATCVLKVSFVDLFPRGFLDSCLLSICLVYRSCCVGDTDELLATRVFPCVKHAPSFHAQRGRMHSSINPGIQNRQETSRHDWCMCERTSPEAGGGKASHTKRGRMHSSINLPLSRLASSG